MNYSRYLLYVLLAIFVSGCGQTVQKSLKVQPAMKSTAGAEKSIVILPFADYSYADNIESAFRRSLYVNENLADQLSSHSFNMPVQEDVFRYLVNQNIINLVAYEDTKTSILEDELNDEWSSVMKGQITRYINQTKNAANNNQPVMESPGTHGLTGQEVVKIGRQFGADYILRGRIIEYKTREDPSWDPMKKGILTFMAGTTNRIAFGNATTDQYDMYGYMLAGALWGGLLGNGASWPWNPGEANQTVFGISGGRDANTIFWGLAGAEFGKLSHSSKATQAVVQLRIWIQDAYTGNVVWTNRVDVKVSPKTVLADYQYDALFESATEKAISTLIDNFVAQAM